MTKYQNTLKEKNKSGVVVNFSEFETLILSPENLSDIQTKWKRQQNLYITCDTKFNVLLNSRKRKNRSLIFFLQPLVDYLYLLWCLYPTRETSVVEKGRKGLRRLFQLK